MKVRNGFVSNSSSSSFLIDASNRTLGEVEEIIEALIKAYNLMENNNILKEEICSVYESHNADNFLEETLKYYSRDRDDMERNLKLKEQYKDKPVIIVDSTTDNSIPWFIQEALEEISVLRQHW